MSLRRPHQLNVCSLVIVGILLVSVLSATNARAGDGYFNPPHSDYGRDTDAPPDGLFNYLTINVSFTITTGGIFMIQGKLYAPDDTLITSKNLESLSLGPGNYVRPLDFEGLDITSKKKDGPYRVELTLRDEGFIKRDNDTYYTKSYTWTQFQMSPAMLSPPHSDIGLDTNSNGKFEYLAVDVEIQVNVTSCTLKLIGNLQDSGESITIESKTITTTLSLGTRTVRVNYTGYKIRESGFSGPYHVKLYLRDMSNNLLSSGTHVTSAYSPNDFEASPAVLVPPPSDFGLDFDSNSRYDYLIVIAKVDVVVAGFYTVRGELSEDNLIDPKFIAFTKNETDFSTGLHNVWLHFLGYSVKTAGVNGKYVIDLEITDASGTTCSTGQSLTTSNYQANDFDELPAKFSTPHSDYGLDTDSNGMYNYLVVDASLSVKIPLTYVLPATLWNYGGSTLITGTTNTSSLPAGSPKLPLWFGGMEIYNSTFSGPYFVRMYIYDPFTNLLNLSSHYTSNYQRSSFEHFAPPDITPPAISSVLASPNPQETGLEVDISATVTDDTGVDKSVVNVTDPVGGIVGSFLMSKDPVSDRYNFSRAYVMIGKYDFQIWATDLKGNNGYAYGSFTMVDSTRPTITDIRVQPKPQEVFNSVNISAVVTDNYKLQAVAVDISSTGNFTMNYDPAQGRYYLSRTYSSPGTFPFTIWAFDSSSNPRSASDAIIVTDSTRPSISDIRVQPKPQEVFNPVNVSAVVTDNYKVQGVAVDIFGIGNFTMSYDPVQSRYFLNRTYSSTGTSPFTVWAFDFSGNWISALDAILVTDSTRPTITDLTVKPPVQQVGGLVNISARIEDNYLLDWTRIKVYDPLGALIVDQPLTYDSANSRYFHTRSYSTLGTHDFIISASDKGGLLSEQWGNFLVNQTVMDITPPTIHSHTASPNPQNVNGIVVIYAVVSDDISLALVTAEVRSPTGADLGNVTMGFDGSVYSRQGTYDELGDHTYCIWAQDASNNGAKACGQFTIEDMVKPVILSVSATPSPQEIHLAVNISATVDDNIEVKSVYLEVKRPDGTPIDNLTMFMEKSSGLCWVTRAYSDLGQHSFTITAIDTYDNVATYVGFFLIRDTTLPVAVAGPDMTITLGDDVTFDASASSDNDVLDNYTWSFNDGPTARLMYGVVAHYTFANDGVFPVTLTVRDRSGNEGTDQLNVTVNKPPLPPANPRPPTNLTLTAVGLTSLELTWTAPTQREDGSTLLDLAGYDIFRSSLPGPPYSKINMALVTSTSCVDSGLVAGMTYHYAVRAVDSQGYESNFSAEASARIVVTGSITGTVIDDAQQPIPGTTAVLYKETTVMGSATTDIQGYFLLSHLEPGSFLLGISHEGYLAREMIVEVKGGMVTDLGKIVLERIPDTTPGGSQGDSAWLVPSLALVSICLVTVFLIFMRRRRRKEKPREGGVELVKPGSTRARNH